MDIGAHYRGEGVCEFKVWVPEAESVTLQLVAPEARSLAMQRTDSGYWEATVPHTYPGTCYRYQLNGQESHPDPASSFQPQGVHGPSQVIDPAFAWTDQAWAGIPLEDLVIYELHVGTFTPEGTFEAIIPRLPELQQLGVTAIELMPIGQFPGDRPEEDDPWAYRNWGYDGVYLYAVQNSYGGPLGLQRLVDAAHQQGIAIILDVVYNHFGPEGNYMSHFGPYFTETYKTPWGSAINFDDRHSPDVRHFFLENALHWLRDYHIDGLRLDAIQAIYDLGARHFLAELTEKVAEVSHQSGWQRYLIAESDLNDARIIRPIDQGGYGLDAQWSDDFHHALQALLTGNQTGYYQDFGLCEQLAKAFRDTFVYDWQYAPHRQRFHGNTCCDRPFTQFVVCIQNHDQVGNSLLGERISALVSFEGVKLAAGTVLLSPYIPLLFMGEEYADEAPFTYFVSHSDPELIRAVREGRKREFEAFHYGGDPPDPEGISTFQNCRLNWQSRHQGYHQVLWAWYQHLLQLRRTLPALVHRDRACLQAGADEEKRLVWWHRWADSQQLLCLMSFNQNETTLATPIVPGNWDKILDSRDGKWQGPGASLPDQWGTNQGAIVPPLSFTLYETCGF